jgi:hypothetical protein
LRIAVWTGDTRDTMPIPDLTPRPLSSRHQG